MEQLEDEGLKSYRKRIALRSIAVIAVIQTQTQLPLDLLLALLFFWLLEPVLRPRPRREKQLEVVSTIENTTTNNASTPASA